MKSFHPLGSCHCKCSKAGTHTAASDPPQVKAKEKEIRILMVYAPSWRRLCVWYIVRSFHFLHHRAAGVWTTLGRQRSSGE